MAGEGERAGAWRWARTCIDGHCKCFPIPECDTWSMSPWHCHAASRRHARAARHHPQPFSMQEEQEVNEPQFGGEGAEGAGGSDGGCCSGASLLGAEVVAEAEIRMALSSVLRYATSFSGDVGSAQLLSAAFAPFSGGEQAVFGAAAALAASCCSSARTWGWRDGGQG